MKFSIHPIRPTKKMRRKITARLNVEQVLLILTASATSPSRNTHSIWTSTYYIDKDDAACMHCSFVAAALTRSSPQFVTACRMSHAHQVKYEASSPPFPAAPIDTFLGDPCVAAKKALDFVSRLRARLTSSLPSGCTACTSI